MESPIKYIISNNEKAAYEYTREIVAASEHSSEYYSFFDDFASLLNNENSYVRTRAFLLCCSQARWDTDGKIRKNLPAMTALFHDRKPTVARQCLNTFGTVIEFQPELGRTVRDELERLDLNGYKNTMKPLLEKDIEKLLSVINNTAEIQNEKQQSLFD